MKTNLMHYFSQFISSFNLYMLASRESAEKHNTYQLLYISNTPPNDGLQICPKHVEVDGLNKLRINSASSWLLLHRKGQALTTLYYLCRCADISVS